MFHAGRSLSCVYTSAEQMTRCLLNGKLKVSRPLVPSRHSLPGAHAPYKLGMAVEHFEPLWDEFEIFIKPWKPSDLSLKCPHKLFRFKNFKL